MDLYSEIILDHYKNPHNYGSLKNPTLSAEDVNPLCGDKIRIDLKLDSKNKVENVGFSGEGCAISQASTSMLTDELLGKSLKEINKLTNEDIYKMIHVPLTPARIKCAILSLVVVKKAILMHNLTHQQKSWKSKSPEKNPPQISQPQNLLRKISTKIIHIITS